MARGKDSRAQGNEKPGEGFRPMGPPPSQSFGPSPGEFDARGVPVSSRLVHGYMVETNGGASLERVPGFNATRALSRGLFEVHPQRHTATPKREAGFELENVIGPDDRVPIPDPTQLPWRCIARLSIIYANGDRATGTAWFIGPNALATAGHNICDPQRGLATSILVTPAYNGAFAPYGSYPVVRIQADERWLRRESNDPALDYGVVFIEDASVGRKLGWFGIASFADNQLLPMAVNVSGYPVDRSPMTQYFNGGRVEQVIQQFLLYSFDTEGGMSGAPIFAMFGQQRVAVGIHTNGSDRINRARRIDNVLFDALRPFAGG